MDLRGALDFSLCHALPSFLSDYWFSFLLTGLCSSMLPVFMCEGIRCQLKSVYNYCCLIYQSAVMFTMFSD